METQAALDRIELPDEGPPGAERVLTAEALAFVAGLHREFDGRRRDLLVQRRQRQQDLDAGDMPDFLSETANIRRAEWRVAPAPRDLQDRRVEITGPAERKMMINALNSGAKVFMADLEDALSPTWSNVIDAQLNLQDAVRGTIAFERADGRVYGLEKETATLIVRPRGWHLTEKHALLDGEAVSASLFDFGMHFFHNARALLDTGSGPYFYLPKLESRMEARLWNDVFVSAQATLGIPRGTVRATILIETILAAFEMDEILYELREHASGLNAGRWDYIFSFIKNFRNREELVLPDRAQITMDVPFMSTYADLLVRTCHRRGAHAIGGMAAFIPNRRDAKVNERAMRKVGEDKEREAQKGFDGTWVAHPDLVSVAQAKFDVVLGDAPHQKHVDRADVRVAARDLLDPRIPNGEVTRSGIDQNVDVALRYMSAWLGGQGAVAIHNLMEDAATAEISRAQLWQWRHHSVPITGDAASAEKDVVLRMSADIYREARNTSRVALYADAATDSRHVDEAAELLDRLVLSSDFLPFLTLPGYRHLA